MNGVINAKLRASLQLADWPRAGFTSALVLGFMCASSVAFSGDQKVEEVHTHVDRPTEQVVGWSMTGQPIKKVDLQYHVRYDDLDLTTKDGVNALRKRISKTALQGCADLGRRYGNIGYGRSCSRAAIRSANVQVDQAIAMARSIAAREHTEMQFNQAIAQSDFSK
jgi:UrcA family protein